MVVTWGERTFLHPRMFGEKRRKRSQIDTTTDWLQCVKLNAKNIFQKCSTGRCDKCQGMETVKHVQYY